MRICLDTNVLLQLFGTQQPYRLLLDAIQSGQIELAVSTEILLEYEETVVALSGPNRWRQIERFLTLISSLHGNILFLNPHFRFGVIEADPDDNKFVDCAISADADFVVTSDRHFDLLAIAAYKPKPITPEKLIANHL